MRKPFRGLIKKGDILEICYTGDGVWRKSKVLKIHRASPKYEMKDPYGGTIRVSRKALRKAKKKTIKRASRRK
jgi:hypothetical protein